MSETTGTETGENKGKAGEKKTSAVPSAPSERTEDPAPCDHSRTEIVHDKTHCSGCECQLYL